MNKPDTPTMFPLDLLPSDTIIEVLRHGILFDGDMTARLAERRLAEEQAALAATARIEEKMTRLFWPWRRARTALGSGVVRGQGPVCSDVQPDARSHAREEAL